VSTLHGTLQSRRRLRWLGFASVLVLVAGIVAVLVVFVGNTGTKLDAPVRNAPAQTAAKEKKVPLEKQARLVAGKFINTAVARQDLAASWPLVGSELKAGMTKKQWLAGNIPVIPFPGKIGQVRMKVDLSEHDHALLEVLVLPAAANVKPAFFFLEMRKRAGHWVVISWAPRSNIALPAAQG
jgi:hypothetical protein